LTATLIVLAHPDRRSFNGAWAEATARASETLGHTVLWSDLVALGFDAVEAARHYPQHTRDGAFDPLKAQETAAAANGIPPDVATEIDKVRRADRIIFHFPLWWFAPPAVLKGWFDRVFLHGDLHTVEQRFDSGLCSNKKAMFCVTTGSSEVESAHNGKEGDVQMLLWPTAYTLRYLGFCVLQPLVVHGVHGYRQGDEKIALQHRLNGVLDAQKDVIAQFDRHPTIAFNADSDFDAEGRLKADRTSHSCFIRHAP